MQYTNQQLLNILVRARDFHLMKTREYGDTGYHTKRFNVCGSIAIAVHWAPRPKRLAQLVRKHIGSHLYMEGFLERKLGYAAFRKLSLTDIQTYRFMMVNNMIRMLGGTP